MKLQKNRSTYYTGMKNKRVKKQRMKSPFLQPKNQFSVFIVSFDFCGSIWPTHYDKHWI